VATVAAMSASGSTAAADRGIATTAAGLVALDWAARLELEMCQGLVEAC
jgi:hypothetical protein